MDMSNLVELDPPSLASSSSSIQATSGVEEKGRKSLFFQRPRNLSPLAPYDRGREDDRDPSADQSPPLLLPPELQKDPSFPFPSLITSFLSSPSSRSVDDAFYFGEDEGSPSTAAEPTTWLLSLPASILPHFPHFLLPLLMVGFSSLLLPPFSPVRRGQKGRGRRRGGRREKKRTSSCPFFLSHFFCSLFFDARLLSTRRCVSLFFFFLPSFLRAAGLFLFLLLALLLPGGKRGADERKVKSSSR